MSTIALAPVPGGRPSTAVPRLRLTRRGRAVAGVLLAAPVALVIALSAVNSAPAQAGVAASAGSFEYITVASGESLWELAAWVAPDADPRDVITAFVQLNQLGSAEVQPGQRLAIPSAYAR